MRLVIAILAPTLLATAAQAGTACTSDGYLKLYSGDRVPTPACQAKLMGRVARAHGVRITDATIQRRPEAREKICDELGYDGGLAYACKIRDRW